MSHQELSAEGFQRLERFMEQFEDKESALIKVLYEAQHIFGYLSREVMLFIAEKLRVPAAKIYGVVSFYAYFTTVPRGKKQVKVCLGTACFVRGAGKIADRLEQELGLKLGSTSSDGEYSLDALRCVGACGLAPVVLVNDKVYGRLEAEQVHAMVWEGRG